MNMTENHKAWVLVLPVIAVAAISVAIPLMMVVGAAVRDIAAPGQWSFDGVEWIGALGRQFLFSGLALAIELPLGVFIALAMPRRGAGVSVGVVVLALPLLVPWTVVGAIWMMFSRPDIGLLGVAINRLGVPFDHAAAPLDAWITVILMDAWHWTPLVALLAYTGLRAIPDIHFQAARIDGSSAWAIIRHVQLPSMRGVLSVAVLLRLIDSFAVYAEPFVLTGGGPGNATTFLSTHLVESAAGQPGPSAALSMAYYLVVLPFGWLLYRALGNLGTGGVE